MSRNKEQANGRETTVMSRVKADSENQEVIDGYDYLGNSSSATDCTGLIPSAPKNQAERDSYEEIYHYQPKPSGKDERQ